MKDSTKIFLGLGVLWLYNQGKRIIKQFDLLQFGVAGFKFITFSTAEQYISVRIDFKVYNPYNIRLMFYSINSELLFNGSFVGNVTSNVNRYIFEKSETVIPIILKLNYKDLGDQIWHHITSGGLIDNWNLKIVGSANVQNITIPLNLSFVFQDFVSGIGALPDDWQNKYLVKLLNELINRGYSYRVEKVIKVFNTLFPLIEKYLNSKGKIINQKNVVDTFFLLYENGVYDKKTLDEFMRK